MSDQLLDRIRYVLGPLFDQIEDWQLCHNANGKPYWAGRALYDDQDYGLIAFQEEVKDGHTYLVSIGARGGNISVTALERRDGELYTQHLGDAPAGTPSMN